MDYRIKGNDIERAGQLVMSLPHGAWLTYSVGNDRGPLGELMMLFYKAGILQLAQKRLAPGRFAYMAQRTTRIPYRKTFEQIMLRAAEPAGRQEDDE